MVVVGRGVGRGGGWKHQLNRVFLCYMQHKYLLEQLDPVIHLTGYQRIGGAYA